MCQPSSGLCHTLRSLSPIFFFFFNHTATTEIYTLSLHDALPIYRPGARQLCQRDVAPRASLVHFLLGRRAGTRSEEHTSELQSPYDLVCRLLLEKKKKQKRKDKIATA